MFYVMFVCVVWLTYILVALIVVMYETKCKSTPNDTHIDQVPTILMSMLGS